MKYRNRKTEQVTSIAMASLGSKLIPAKRPYTAMLARIAAAEKSICRKPFTASALTSATVIRMKVGSGAKPVDCTTSPSTKESSTNARISMFCRFCGYRRAMWWTTCG